jgi:hypothetical protein
MEWLKNVMEAKKQKESKSKPDREPGKALTFKALGRKDKK